MKSQEKSIDIIAILVKTWSGRKLIIKTVYISFAIGCLVALLSPVLHESKTTFVPQTSDQSSTNNQNLGSLASLAGINLNAATSSSIDNYLSPLLYSKIIESEEFTLSLINEDIITINGEKIKAKDYIIRESGVFNLNPINFLIKYTIDLFLIEDDKEFNSKEFDKTYNFISNEDYNHIKSFKNKYSIEINKKDGYIKVLGYDKDAFISSQIVNLVTKNLQHRIISLRTKKIKAQLDFSKEQYDRKKEEFESLQNKLAIFKDSNKNISTAVFLAELQKLESEYKLQENILNSLASEYNSNKIKLNKTTPIFSVLDEVSVPNERSKPERKKIVFIYTFLGIILSIGYVLAKEPFIEILQKIKNN